MHAYLRYALERQEEIAALIQRLVEAESPTDSPESVDHVMDLLIEVNRDLAQSEVVPSPRFGKHLKLTFGGSGKSQSRQLLAIGHADTVWPLGTLRQMPFRKEEGRLWGPGVLDMKSGLVIFLYAMRLLREMKIAVNCPVVLLVVSDEEVGSPDSRPLTEAEGRKSRAAFILEPGTGLSGKLKTARKGVGRYLIRVEGVAAHAGVDFQAGASAIVEAAHQIQEVAKLSDRALGVTVNPGVVRGGTRSNVVAASAEIEVDVRAVTESDARQVGERLSKLQALDPRCRISVEGGPNRPPMERNSKIAALFESAREVGREIGLELEESATGGGSDGNFTAALGIPTLDGLGAVGEGAHAVTESVLLERIPERIALLAGLISRVSSEHVGGRFA